MNKSTKNFTRFAILLAIEAVFCFTPLGSLPAIGPIVATLAMIPVVVTAHTMGVRAGGLMGFFAGLFSFIVWSFMPPNPALAFVFTPLYSFAGVSGGVRSLLICFVPRILVGVVAAAVYQALRHKPNVISYGVSGFLGSMMNTIFVMGGIYVFFGRSYAEALGVGFEMLLGLIWTTVLTSGIPEAVISALTGIFVSSKLNKYFN